MLINNFDDNLATTSNTNLSSTALNRYLNDKESISNITLSNIFCNQICLFGLENVTSIEISLNFSTDATHLDTQTISSDVSYDNAIFINNGETVTISSGYTVTVSNASLSETYYDIDDTFILGCELGAMDNISGTITLNGTDTKIGLFYCGNSLEYGKLLQYSDSKFSGLMSVKDKQKAKRLDDRDFFAVSQIGIGRIAEFGKIRLSSFDFSEDKNINGVNYGNFSLEIKQ